MASYRVERRGDEVVVYADSEGFFLASLPVEELEGFVKEAGMVVIVYPSGRRVYVSVDEVRRLLEAVKDSS